MSRNPGFGLKMKRTLAPLVALRKQEEIWAKLEDLLGNQESGAACSLLDAQDAGMRANLTYCQ